MTDPNGPAPTGQPQTLAPALAAGATTPTPVPARAAAPVAALPETGTPTPPDDDGHDPDPRIARANKQAADYRIRAKEAAERAATAEAELTRLRQAAMTEEQRRQADFEAATKRVNELEGAARDHAARVQALAVENAVLRAVTNLRSAKDPLHFVDSEAVLALLDRKSIQYDDDGQPLPDRLDQALRTLAKQKPYLVAAPTTPGYSASPANPARGHAGGGDAPPTSLDDLKGKSLAYINAHWEAVRKAQAAAKGGR